MNFYTLKLRPLPIGLCKFIRLIRLVTLFFIFSFVRVNAASYGQKLTIKNATLNYRQIFMEIKQQTGYDVLWQATQFNASEHIAVSFIDASLKEVMNTCIEGKHFSYTIEGMSIVITAKEPVKGDIVQVIRQDSVIYSGIVFDEKGRPMVGATIRLKDGSRSTFSNRSGEFRLYGPLKGSLIISYVGYLNKEITLLRLKNKSSLSVSMVAGSNNLGEVNIVSTGYQEIAKERATGSFEVVTKEQLQHSTSPSLIRRLEGITTGINFNNQLVSPNSSNGMSMESPITNLTIRGKNTLNSNNITSVSGQVLVVIDGIPSPYSIDKVNPNDVESVTLLKDAASASIWGARAANGVIVVKTKKGGYNRQMNVSFNSSFNVTEKLDLFYRKKMSTSDYIDAQVQSYNSIYDPADTESYLADPILANGPQNARSPVFEIMNRRKMGRITSDQAAAQLDSLRSNDIRRDYSKYFLRNALQQSYSLALDGGGSNVTYYLSVGYDKLLNNTKGSDGDRLALTYRMSVRPVKNLELLANIDYNLQQSNNQGTNVITGITDLTFYPYSKLADEKGNHLPIDKTYRSSYLDLLDAAFGDKILEMRYVPLDDIDEGYLKNNAQNINLGLTAVYRFRPAISANLTYNYNKGIVDEYNLVRQNSFFMRDQINFYTDPSNFTKALPLGGNYRTSGTKSENQILRGQLNLNKEWGLRHGIAAVGGVDMTQTISLALRNEYYGYNENTLTSQQNLPFNTNVPLLYYPGSFGILPNLNSGFTNIRTRTLSVYANAAYTFLQRYTVSGSIRKDGSSEFGMGSNKGGTPFYSMGLSWNVNKEAFYYWDLIPRLQLRGTFGYNGNANPLISANQFIYYDYFPQGNTGLPYAYVSGESISNRLLRPERTGIFNIGLDFGFENNRVSGSLEYYNKKTTDLLSGGPSDPTTGFDYIVFNNASLKGYGWDLNLNSVNLRSGSLSWNSNFLFSYNRVKVTDVFSSNPQTAQYYVGENPSYNKGYDLSRMFGYAWGGLDPLTGDPRGIVDGSPVTVNNSGSGRNNFIAIAEAPINTSSVKYIGSAVPVYFGSLRNTFGYRGFSISVNLLYKLGYYFRRRDVVNYDNLFSQQSLQSADYGNRWQNPGDEKFTNVPSLTFPTEGYKDEFYQFAEVNVLKGDHIRLQEVNLSYSFGGKGWFLKNPRVYANISNLGVIWRANKLRLDPDTFDYPVPRTYSFGLSANF